MTTDRLAALLAEVTTRANAVVREQDAIDFIDWCRDDLPAAAGVIVAQPATALKPCKTHGLDGHLYDCDAVRWVPYQPAPDALRAALEEADRG